MIVISDTTAISTLIQIQQLELLKKIFSKVSIPKKVFDELLVMSKFGIDISALLKADWLEVTEPSPSSLLTLLNTLLDEGEASAIALAVEFNADLLIIDEAEGRQVAASMNLPFIGLGGVFIKAKQAAIISDVTSMLDIVEHKTSFYLSKKARSIILEAAGEQP